MKGWKVRDQAGLLLGLGATIWLSNKTRRNRSRNLDPAPALALKADEYGTVERAWDKHIFANLKQVAMLSIVGFVLIVLFELINDGPGAVEPNYLQGAQDALRGLIELSVASGLSINLGLLGTVAVLAIALAQAPVTLGELEALHTVRWLRLLSGCSIAVAGIASLVAAGSLFAAMSEAGTAPTSVVLILMAMVACLLACASQDRTHEHARQLERDVLQDRTRRALNRLERVPHTEVKLGKRLVLVTLPVAGGFALFDLLLNPESPGTSAFVGCAVGLALCSALLVLMVGIHKMVTDSAFAWDAGSSRVAARHAALAFGCHVVASLIWVFFAALTWFALYRSGSPSAGLAAWLAFTLGCLITTWPPVVMGWLWWPRRHRSSTRAIGYCARFRPSPAVAGSAIRNGYRHLARQTAGQ